MSDGYDEVTIESVAQWRDWLTANHATAPGVWVTTYKKNSGRPSVPVGDIVDEALAHGWIDSRPRSLDENRSQRLLTPRRPTRSWSRVNKQRVERLIAAILEWIASAKTPSTRNRRVAETASKAAANLRANQWRQPRRGQPAD